MNIEKVMLNLEKNNMKPYLVETAADVKPLVKSLLKKGDSVGVGGSVSLDECDILSLLRNGDYNFLDRYDKALAPEERKALQKRVMLADSFITSSNAVTEAGELINVDGFASRIAPLIFGPDNVIVVVGANKIVATAEDGFRRIKETAAPKNTKRLNMQTYCKEKGVCMALEGGGDSLSCGCSSPDRICCNYLVSAYQRAKDRIKVIICKENLGY